jgi:hypothetical protein
MSGVQAVDRDTVESGNNNQAWFILKIPTFSLVIDCKSIPKVLRNLAACCVNHALKNYNRVNVLEMLPYVDNC